jgi:hypothetical protein
MNPIFFCKKCQKTFEISATQSTVILEKGDGYDVQDLRYDDTRKPVCCPDCQEKNLILRDNGCCALLKRPTRAKFFELRQIKTQGLPAYMHKMLEKIET